MQVLAGAVRKFGSHARLELQPSSGVSPAGDTSSLRRGLTTSTPFPYGGQMVSKKASADLAAEDITWQEMLRAARVKPVPELYFATVRAIGTPVTPVAAALERSLKEARFELQTVKVSEALDQETLIGTRRDDDHTRYDRYRRLGQSAIRLRQETEMRDAVAVAAVERMHNEVRPALKRKARKASALGVAFLFRNLMHHEEVARLRKLYDRQFFLISIYSPRTNREANLAEELGKSLSDGIGKSHRRGGESHEAAARDLIETEEEFFRRSRRYDPATASQRRDVTNIPKTFQYGDLFVDAADPGITEQIERFVDLIFGYPFHTPTRDEIGMADAFSAALQSGNLARQVGAAICSEEGDLISTGTNDVPKPGGGVYRSDDGLDDYRDHNLSPRIAKFARGFDVSDPTRRSIFEDLVHRMLADPGWLEILDEQLGGSCSAGGDLATRLVARARPARDEPFSRSTQEDYPAHELIDLEPVLVKLIESNLIWGAQFFDVLEYGRTMHAEMDAITSAARKGVSVRGATLYCTTLPCHECARLIIGAGIRRVIYIEPYEKSRSGTLFDSEIQFTTLERSRSTDDVDGKRYVDFVPYVGVSPRRFAELFAKGDRKLQDQTDKPRNLSGERAQWSKSAGRVRETIVSESAIATPRRLADILDHERQLIRAFREALEAARSGDD